MKTPNKVKLPKKKVVKEVVKIVKIKVNAFGILNAHRKPWTKKTFETIEDAERYMEVFWGDMKNPPDMSKHEVVPVTITYTV